MFTGVLLDEFLNGFSKFGFFIVEICILIWDFWVIFENYSKRMLSIRENDLSHTEHTRKRFHRTLSIRRTIFAYAQPAEKCQQFLHVQICWAYGEMILSHPEHTRKWFKHWLSIRGNDFTADWAYAEMFKSRISRPNQIRFSKISCYRPLGP